MSATELVEIFHENRLPPCNAECPVGHDVQGWLAAAAKGAFRRAWDIMMQRNPLPATMGRVCYHTCEGACNRREFDQPVSIHAVERFIGDLALEQGWQPADSAASPSGKRILVVGSGPAGLSAAYHQTRLGHAVTIAEAAPRAGGMLAYGIPAYRLPRHILDAEIARIVAVGVTLRLQAPIHDIAAALRDGGYDACFAAIGAHVARRIELLPTNPAQPTAIKVLDAVAVLRAMESGEETGLGKRIIVYGGGNTAIDVARTAVREGAEEVRIVYRRSRARMPAHAFEIEDALEEGVLLHDLRTIKSLGQAAIVLEKMVLGEAGWPQPTGHTEALAADTVVLALGQDVDASPFRSLADVAVAADGTVGIGADFRTGHPGVFAGGDAIPANRTVSVAVGHGERAARQIDAWLRGEQGGGDAIPDLAPFARINKTYYRRSTRASEPRIEAAARRQTFNEFVGGLSTRAVLKEAGRCLSCGTCLACDACLKLCPDRAISRLESGEYHVDPEKCRHCGVCVAQCPCGAIHVRHAAMPNADPSTHVIP